MRIRDGDRWSERVPETVGPWPWVAEVADGPIDWTRQTLFVKDREAAGVNYYLFRDTVSGGQPTEWTFWTMSDRLGTAEGMAGPAAALANKPGPQIVPLRELPQSPLPRG